jgi:hypothetical protein
MTVSAVTSGTAANAGPARLADWTLGHWGIEAFHHIRDTSCPQPVFAITALESDTLHMLSPWGYGLDLRTAL